MKELSIKEKAQAYDKAIKEAYIAYKDEDRHLKATLERIFPDLKDSDNGNIDNQNSLKSTNMYKTKLQKGDWISIEKPCQIINITDNKDYIVQYCDDENIHIISKNFCESHFHPWSIEEVKDGDVLYSPSHHLIWIYKDNTHYYAGINMNYINENVSINGLISIPNDVCPAPKDKQDILFAMMKNIGYGWDPNLKVLIKKTKMTHTIEPQEKGGNGVIRTNSCEWCNRDTCEDCYDY